MHQLIEEFNPPFHLGYVAATVMKPSPHLNWRNCTTQMVWVPATQTVLALTTQMIWVPTAHMSWVLTTQMIWVPTTQTVLALTTQMVWVSATQPV